MNVALITAGGIGSRTNQEVPKQFLTVFNKPLIIHTLEIFQEHPHIDAIVISCLSGWEPIMEAYAKQYKITKLKCIITSADTPQQSIYNCLTEMRSFCGDDDLVLVHDGNRCLVTEDIISNAIVTCRGKGNAIVVVPCNEVIYETDDQVSSNVALNRDRLKRTQTPHVFPFGKLYWAHEEAKKRGIHGTVASCDLMTALGEKIYFSLGSERNIKITTVSDVEIFKALLKAEREEDGFNC